eukprot:COSAG06_NODE_6718_length_2811_cov_3.835546_2_plen_372_part_00
MCGRVDTRARARHPRALRGVSRVRVSRRRVHLGVLSLSVRVGGCALSTVDTGSAGRWDRWDLYTAAAWKRLRDAVSCRLSLSRDMAAEAADTSVEAATSLRGLPSPPRPGSSRRLLSRAEHSARSVGEYDPLPGEGGSVAVALSVSPSEGENCIGADELVVPPVRCVFARMLEHAVEQPTDVESGLKDGTLSPNEAIIQLQRQISELRAVCSVRKQHAEASHILAAVARVEEVPTNQHQAVVFLAASDIPSQAKYALPMMILSFLLVGFQMLVAVGIITRTIDPSCVTNDQCDGGSFCNIEIGKCFTCGSLCFQTTANNWTVQDGSCPHQMFFGFNASDIHRMCANPNAVTVVSTPKLTDNAVVRPWCDAW